MAHERFSRLIPMIGAAGMARTQNARIALFGLGGVGGSCMEALVRGGIGALTLVDGDTVEVSNLNRQSIAFECTLGMRKVHAAERLAHAINPHCTLELIDHFVKPEDASVLLDEITADESIDYIIDCIDTIGTKIALALWAQNHGVPYIGSAGTARKFDATRFEFANIYDTSVCPLCRALRREARKQGISQMEVLYSKEVPFTNGNTDDERVLGTLSYVPPVAGMLLAGRVLQAISCGSPERTATCEYEDLPHAELLRCGCQA